MMRLCGDVGGTNARLALWDGALTEQRQYPSGAHADLRQVIERWLADSGVRPSAACLAVAGPVADNRCVATNLPWVIDGDELGKFFGFPVRIINDFHAAARGTTLLSTRDVVQLGGGPVVPGAPVGVLGAGTGLGEAYLVGGHVIAGEGGHAEFGPGNAREARLSAWLVERYGRASWEHVLSGAGLVNLARFACWERGEAAPAWLDDRETAAARVSTEQADVVSWFCELYGSEAGNMALRVLARGGVYLCGGIAPRLVAQLSSGGFRRRFEAKGKLGGAIAPVPVFVSMHPALGLLGAAAELGSG